MAADTFTSLLGLILMGTGNDNNNWGALLNASMISEVELAIAGVNTQAVTGGTLDLSASPPPAGPSGAVHRCLVLNGTLGSNQIVQVPNLTKTWLVQNNTAGAFTLTFKTPSGSASTAIPQNAGWQRVMCDGANGITVDPFNSKQIQLPDGTISTPPFSNINEPTSGWRRAGTQDWRLSVAGVDVLQITGAGAGTPNVANFITPQVQQAGVQIIPPGGEIDYAGLTAPTGWYFPVGQAVNRTTDAPLFTALTTTCTGNTHTNTTLDNLSTDLRGLGLVGAFIEGTGIPTGATIASINSATSLTLSAAAVSTSTGITIRVLPWGQGDASTTFNLPDRRGTAPLVRDDLGGTAKGNLTNSATGGIDGTKLNATGGEQAHTLLTAEMPSHGHSTTEVAHSHFMTAGHTSPRLISTSSGGPLADPGSSPGSRADISQASTEAIATGLSINNTGGGGAHNLIPPASICNRIIKR